MRLPLNLTPQDKMDYSSAPNVSSKTLDPRRLTLPLPDVDGSSDGSSVDGSSAESSSLSYSLPLTEAGEDMFACIIDEEAQSEDPGVSCSFRLLNDDSALPLSSVSASAVGPSWHSSSMVTAVAPEEWSLDPAHEMSWLHSEDSDEISASEVGAGLSNLGNTCFLNAILQCFTHTVPLVQGLRSLSHSTPCAGHVDGFCVICALREHLECSLATRGGVLSPSKLVDNLNYFSSEFRRFEQEDAHEFMQCALDKLERCFLDLKKSNPGFEVNNLVEKVFGGRLISKLRCCSCGHSSDTCEPLIDLSLEIENVDTLPSALESFTTVENIDGMFRCDSCKEEVSKEKQLMLDRAPSVAAFHLKRFKTDGTSVQKIDKHVDFPLELDLQPYTISNQNNNVPLKYDLYAVVVHIGFTYTSGHYFCFVRSSPDTWHKLDDSKVTKVSTEFVRSQEAYILFYAQQGTPWFSTLMESWKPCLDLNLKSPSPTSVLDVIDSINKSDLISLANNELCDASGSNQGSVVSDGSEDVLARILLESDAILDGNAVFDGDENLCCHEVVDFAESDCFHSLTPPSSPSSAPLRFHPPTLASLPSDAPDKFCISRDHLKENQGNCKRPSIKLTGVSERLAALKYVNKMPGSRRGAFLQLVGRQNEVSLEKKRKRKPT